MEVEIVALGEIGAGIIYPVDEHRMARQISVTAVPPMMVSVVNLARSKITKETSL